jgi:phosphoglucosamine mutase
MRQLFGTDGMRGLAGSYPLDPATTFALGAALGRWVVAHPANHTNPEVVIGVDTRESGPWIAAHVAGGLKREGVRARFAGLITTPGVAYIARSGPFAAGVMISASHNAYHDNGIKIIDHSGFKLPDEQEHVLERDIFAFQGDVAPAKLTSDEGLDRAYADYLASTLPDGAGGVRIAVDAANGAATYLAPALFERLGARVDMIGASPDGKNINLKCGSLHLDGLRVAVIETGADFGVAFDGDADRALFVSHSGKVVDGDAVLLLCARPLHARGHLKEVIATVMSNLGLERALQRDGIGLVRTPVGDKYVLEEMVRRDAPLGGEQSGHVIFRDYATTGDGLLTTLRVLEVMRESGANLDDLTAGLEVYPQLLVNVKVQDKRPLSELQGVADEIRRAESEFGNAGRVLVRFSGTEPLARVMVEGPEIGRVEHFAHSIAAAIRQELGTPQ